MQSENTYKSEVHTQVDEKTNKNLHRMKSESKENGTNLLRFDYKFKRKNLHRFSSFSTSLLAFLKYGILKIKIHEKHLEIHRTPKY